MPARVRNLSAGVVKVPLSLIKAVLTAKASDLYRKWLKGLVLKVQSSSQGTKCSEHCWCPSEQRIRVTEGFRSGRTLNLILSHPCQLFRNGGSINIRMFVIPRKRQRQNFIWFILLLAFSALEETELAALGNLFAGPFVDYTRRSRSLEERTNQNSGWTVQSEFRVPGEQPWGWLRDCASLKIFFLNFKFWGFSLFCMTSPGSLSTHLYQLPPGDLCSVAVVGELSYKFPTFQFDSCL